MVKINMGCGWRNFGSDWVHIDGGDYDHIDYKSLTALEFEDNSVDLIYASHVLEYFDRVESEGVLSEWARVLQKDATLRLAVPNFSALNLLYITGDLQLDNLLGPLYGRMPMAEQTIYHKTAYDLVSLKLHLEQNGFYDVKEYDWRETEHADFDDHSQAYYPHMDKENGVLVSLNVECRKR